MNIYRYYFIKTNVDTFTWCCILTLYLLYTKHVSLFGVIAKVSPKLIFVVLLFAPTKLKFEKHEKYKSVKLLNADSYKKNIRP